MRRRIVVIMILLATGIASAQPVDLQVLITTYPEVGSLRQELMTGLAEELPSSALTAVVFCLDPDGFAAGEPDPDSRLYLADYTIIDVGTGVVAFVVVCGYADREARMFTLPVSNWFAADNANRKQLIPGLAALTEQLIRVELDLQDMYEHNP